jgi:hypothetical protein
MKNLLHRDKIVEYLRRIRHNTPWKESYILDQVEKSDLCIENCLSADGHTPPPEGVVKKNLAEAVKHLVALKKENLSRSDLLAIFSVVIPDRQPAYERVFNVLLKEADLKYKKEREK